MVIVKADNRGRIKLPHPAPGQLFVLSNDGNNSMILTPVRKAAAVKSKVKFIKKNGFIVGHTSHKVSHQALKKLLADFP